MKDGKDFDCVEMKVEVQDRLLREASEFGEAEARRRRAERLSREPILGAFLRKITPAREGSAERR